MIRFYKIPSYMIFIKKKAKFHGATHNQVKTNNNKPETG